MKTNRYSVQAIAEILISELGSLESSAKAIKQAVDQANGITIKVDDQESHIRYKESINQLKALFDSQRDFLNKVRVVPLWIYIFTFSSWIITALSIYWGITQYSAKQKIENMTKIEINKQ